jgi:hypothetical protein
MNKQLIKSLVIMIAVMCSFQFANAAGAGTAASPYTVCATSGFKLDATVTGAAASGYIWKDNAGTLIPSQTTATYTIAAPGTAVTTVTTVKYYVQATISGTSCPSDVDTIYVTLVPPATLTVPTFANVCALLTGGSATTMNLSVTSTPATLPTGVTVSYSNWSAAVTPASGYGTITQGAAGSGNATTTTPTVAGSYTYNVTSSYAGLDVNTANFCQGSSAAHITINPLPAKPAATISAN